MTEAPTAIQRFLRSELSFYGTVAVAVMAFAGMYFGVINQINLMSQKMDMHIESTAYLPMTVATIKEQLAVLVSQNKT